MVVWPHGVAHLDGILSHLLGQQGISVNSIFKEEDVSIRSVVKRVYRFDSSPLRHLNSKIEYLNAFSNGPATVFHIFFSIRNPDFRPVGDGAFRHLQCEKVKKLKTEIRKKYNPRVNGFPGHEHVVHCSDTPDQAQRMASSMGFEAGEPGNSPFEKSVEGFAFPWHIQSPRSFQVSRVELSSCLVSLALSSGPSKVPITQTPHYRSLVAESRELYDDYRRGEVGQNMTDGHHWLNLLALRDEYEPGEGNLPIVKREDGGFRVLDGAHRLAVLCVRGHSSAAVVVISD